MAWEENSRICLHMQLIAILSRIGVINIFFSYLNGTNPTQSFALFFPSFLHSSGILPMKNVLILGQDLFIT